jgi:hypothetical protein
LFLDRCRGESLVYGPFVNAVGKVAKSWRSISPSSSRSPQMHHAGEKGVSGPAKQSSQPLKSSSEKAAVGQSKLDDAGHP